jgi:NitT/TauT family transport system permease protein
MIRGQIGRTQRWLLGAVSILVLLGSYTWLSHRQHERNPDDTTIPSWSQLREGVATAVLPNPRSGERWIVEDAKATLTRLFLGLLYGIGGAPVGGVGMGCFPRMEALLAPPLALLAKIPPTAALAVFFVLFGTDLQMYTAMIAFGILPSMAQSVYLAVDDIPGELIHKSYTLGASHLEVIWNVICRNILPRLIDSIRLQIGPAMVYLIAAEMVTGDVGFGYRIRLQSRLLNMNVVYPYLASLAAFGFLMDAGLRGMQRWLSPWYADRGRG